MHLLRLGLAGLIRDQSRSLPFMDIARRTYRLPSVKIRVGSPGVRRRTYSGGDELFSERHGTLKSGGTVCTYIAEVLSIQLRTRE